MKRFASVRRFATQAAAATSTATISNEKLEKYKALGKKLAFWGFGAFIAWDINLAFSDDKKAASPAGPLYGKDGYPVWNEKNKSLLRKYLTPEVFAKLKDKKTKYGFTLQQVINSGVHNQDSNIGVYAGDEESYTVFADLFDPVIKEYHDGFGKDGKHKTDFKTPLKAPEKDEKGEFIVSTRIRVGRNLAGFPLGAGVSQAQLLDIEKQIVAGLNGLEGDLAGKYYPLKGMSKEDANQLQKDHFLFKSGDRFLEHAGLNKFWPDGRGIYHNKDKTFLVWVNEEDQLRIISMQNGGDVNQVFQRLGRAVEQLQKRVKFSYNDHLGNISSCPTNLGTAMRASVHIKLPLLSKDQKTFQAIADKHHLQIRGIHGEHTEDDSGVFDVSNSRRLGFTEAELVQGMYDGIQELISKEKELKSKPAAVAAAPVKKGH